MQLWLDSIDLKTIAQAEELGLIDGVTTNPSILSQSSNVTSTLNSLLKIQRGLVAIQVTEKTSDKMIEEGRFFFEFSDRVVVKIPLNNQGMKAIKQLSSEGINVLATAIFQPRQAFIAAKLGATYIAPYLSHLDEFGNAYEIMQSIIMAARCCNPEIIIMAASLKNLDQFTFCTQADIDIVTAKEDFFLKLIADHSQTEKVTNQFLNEWQNLQKSPLISNLSP